MTMEFEGSYYLDATPAEVWEALNSEEVLAQCIPGCETVERKDERSFTALVVLRIGPVKARFNGNVSIDELERHRLYRIEGEGKGGVAGFARGQAHLTLMPEDAGTRLSYNVEAKIGGKIAQLGNRMLSSTVQKLSDSFFENLSRVLKEE